MPPEAWFPVELYSELPCITLKGMDLVEIEQHKGLIAYQGEQIVLRTSIGRLCIHGEELCFKHYSAQDAVITGKVKSVSYEGVAQ